MALYLLDLFGFAVSGALTACRKSMDLPALRRRIRGPDGLRGRGPYLIVVVMDAIAGSAGGIMRDVLCAEVPLILRREIYATASVAGAAVFVVLQEIGASGPLMTLLPIATTFMLRLAAIRFDLHVPPFRPKDG